MAKKDIEVKFGVVARNEVFEPIDNWFDSDGRLHYFVPFRSSESGAALRVRKVHGRGWRPFDERPLHAEQSFFHPDEPGRIVGNYHT